MGPTLRTAFRYIFAIALFAGWAAGTPGQEGLAGNQLGKKISAFKKHLAKKGFTVAGREEGTSLEKVPLIQLCCAHLVPSCFAYNPTSPYVAVHVPDHPDQAQQCRANFRWVFRLLPGEAVVLVARTPPECTYFSYCAYVNDVADPDHPRCGPTGRIPVFASLGDTVNLRTIRSSGTPGGEKGDPFRKVTVIVLTADAGTDKKIRAAAAKAGLPEAVINTVVLPSHKAEMGFSPASAEFSLINRVAIWDDPSEGEAYLSYPLGPGGEDGEVLRVTPSGGALEPFGSPKLRTHGTGTVEHDWKGQVDALRRSILEEELALHPGWTYRDLKTTQWLPEGMVCVQGNANCLGENRDTIYLKSEDYCLDADPQAYVVAYGVNHGATGKATYANASIYAYPKLQGVGGVKSTDEEEFTGRARAYLGDAYPPGGPYLYAYKMARSCHGEPYCMDVPEGCVDAQGNPQIEEGSKVFVGFRAYLEKKTAVSPAHAEVLYDQVLLFSPSEIPAGDCITCP